MGYISAQIEGIEWILFLVLIAIVFLIVSRYLLRRQKLAGRSEGMLPSIQPYYPMPPPSVVQQTVERQVVKVRCRHCGALNLETSTICVACKAPL